MRQEVELDNREKLREIKKLIKTPGWNILLREAEQELEFLGLELRQELSPRIAGKMEGIEWVFFLLPERIKARAEMEEKKT